jgi:hypothetical protein
VRLWHRSPARALWTLALAVAVVAGVTLIATEDAGAATLGMPAWSASSTVTGATGVTYTYSFTTGSGANLVSVTMTVPAGTAGVPTVSSVSGLPTNGSVSLTGTTLTYTFGVTYVGANAVVNLEFAGLTNTTTAGSTASVITTNYDTYGTPASAPEDTGTTAPVAFGPGTLTNPTWSVSSTVTGAGSVGYTYGATTSDTATLTSVSLSLPAGTGGTAAVGTVSGVPTGGSATRASNVLTYTFSPTLIASGTVVSIQITGLTNTSSATSFAAQVVTSTASGPDATGFTGALSFAAGTLGVPIWKPSSSTTSATALTYTYTFTTATGATLTSVAMTVPPGTTGSPAVGTVSGVPTTGSISLTSDTLTYSFGGTYLNGGTSVSIGITGLNNTSTAGNYFSEIATAGASGPVDAANTAPVSIAGGVLPNPIWTVSGSAKGGTGVAYSYTFTTATAATLASVTMTVPPGTAGSPAVGTVSGVPSGGTVSLASNTLTYSFSGTSVPSDTAVSVQITGMTNTSTVGNYTSQVTTDSSTEPIDTGVTPAVAISSGTLTNPIWTVSNSVSGTTGVTYTYSFTTATGDNLTSVTMSVPPGTGGSPAIGAVSGVPTGGTLSLNSNTLTYSFTSTYVNPNTAVSVHVTGLTNTSTVGSYTSQLVTNGNNGSPPNFPIDSAITAALAITGGSLSNVIWTVSNAGVGSTAVTYTYTFKTATPATLVSVTMTVPPGTAGPPAVGTVTGVPSGGTVSLASNTLTYSFSGTSVPSGTSASIQITGMTNTSATGSYTSQITTNSAGGPVDTGLTAAVSIAGGSLSSPIWTVSNSVAGTTGVTYTYSFETESGAELASVTMVVPPGTAGTPGIGSVSGVPTAGDSATLASNTITYSFAPNYVNGGTSVSIQITGLTNTSAVGTYTSQITTNNSTGGPVDTGQTAPTSISGGSLVSPIWNVSATGSGAAGVTYTYTFKTASTAMLVSVTMTVPPGTGGSPALGTVTGVPSGGSVSLASNTLTYSFSATSVPSATSVSIQITAMTNTSTVGSYTSQITTNNASGPVDTGLTAAVAITGGSLVNPIWTVSNSVAGTTGVTYTYTFTTASGGELTSVTMTVPPGTGGSPAVGTVSGVPTAGNSVSLASNTLTYSFTPGYVNGGTSVSIQITGLSNTSVVGSYTSQITTNISTGPVDTGLTAAIAISGGSLVSPIWNVSSAGVGTTGVTYTYTFKTASSAMLVSVTMTVPPGTAGTPAVGTVTGVPSGGSVSLASNTLTYSFSATSVPTNTSTSIQITGMTNTATSGSYTSQITTNNASGPVDTGLTAAVSIAGGTLSSPIWTVSNSVSGTTGVTYTYTFTTATGSSLASVTMTVPPGTAGTPGIGSVSGVPTAGDNVSLASNSLTYSFTPTFVNAGTAVSIGITGMTNTAVVGSYTSQLTTNSASAPVDTGQTAAISISGGTLVSPIWTVSSAGEGTTGVTYTYSFTTASTASLISASFTVPPGTGGSPGVGTVTGVPSGGRVSLASNTLTYSFSATTVPTDTSVSIGITGMTNTATGGGYTSQITTYNASGPVDTGQTAAVSIAGGTLTSPTWSISNSITGTTGVTYTYTFTTATGSALASVTMTVPPGTAGTPGIGSVSGVPTAGNNVSLASNSLTYSFTPTYVNAGTSVSIGITGMTNTAAAGSYTSQLTTNSASAPVDTAQTPSVTMIGTLSLIAPTALSWSALLNGSNQSIPDTTAADEEYTVDDTTGSGAGWNVTVSATTFTDGSHTLPDSGTFLTTGSVTSSTATTAPTSTCVSVCTLPTNSLNYPVAITTATSSPPAYRVFDAAVGTGKGDITIGGSTSANPVGWWVTIPSRAFAGTYVSTVTVAMVSGP